MTSATLHELFSPVEGEASSAPVRVARRRARGLRLSVLPSWPLLSQFGGGAAVLGGVYLQWGVAIALIVGGVAAAALGMLREGGKI